MRNAIIRVWNGEAKYTRWLFYAPLRALSAVYSLCLRIREKIYERGWIQTKGVTVPVISVGNISLGGTGKTPVVEKLTAMLREAGFSPAIVTRGYKRKRRGTFLVDPNVDRAEDVGDEALMLARKTRVPVLVGSKRAEAIALGMKSVPMDLVILDDGFQVRDIEKDMEVLVLNAREGRGGYGLFPLGPFREPLARIRDADVVLVNKGDLTEEMGLAADGLPTFRMGYAPAYLYNLKANGMAHYKLLKGKRVAAFSGLGDNRSFFNLLRELGADVVREVSFPDHHAYSESEVERIASYGGVDLVVTTEKDAIKMADMDVPANLFYLAVTVSIEREAELFDLIENRLKREICQRESLYSIRH
jgi:tetraacyldisaccharide 4'-kinase